MNFGEKARPHEALQKSETTRILRELSGGNQDALHQLMPIVYRELRRLAMHYLRRERPDHTLQATALVHEAFLRLIDQTNVQWRDRAHFIGISAHLMREILINHAIAHKRLKRGGGQYKVSVDETVARVDRPEVDLIALNDALNELAAIDPRQSEIVELRFFGGLSVDETAEALNMSTATVKREWRLAKAWLYSRLK
jgi:RNA polymerase sigma-70 factor (ECF subfamily)